MAISHTDAMALNRGKPVPASRTYAYVNGTYMSTHKTRALAEAMKAKHIADGIRYQTNVEPGAVHEIVR